MSYFLGYEHMNICTQSYCKGELLHLAMFQPNTFRQRLYSQDVYTFPHARVYKAFQIIIFQIIIKKFKASGANIKILTEDDFLNMFL